MRRILNRIISCVTLIGLMCSFLRIPMAVAASVSSVSDAMTSHVAGAVSNHSIVFTTPSGVHASTSTIVVTLGSFNLGALTAGDITLTHGPSTGLETSETIAATPAAGVWGASISGADLTLTPPTNATTNEIAANDIVRLTIGGTNQAVNPASVGSYQGTIGGAFGDTGIFGLIIVTSEEVVVTAQVEAQNPGGHGTQTDTTPPLIVNVLSSSTSPTSASIQWITSEGSTSAVDYGLTASYASGTASDSSLVFNHSVGVNNLTPCTTYQFQVRSSDSSGNEAISSGYTFQTTCDTVPPVISGVHADQVTDSSVSIIWTTDEPSTSRVEFGVGGNYIYSSETLDYVSSHSLPLAGLSPNTAYDYRVISRDVSGNQSISTGWVFVTGRDVTSPTNVMLTATPGDALIVLHWTQPIEPDVAGVVIVRRTDRYPSGPTDGSVIFQGTQLAITDPGLVNGTTYFYGAFVYDRSGNYSSGSLASAVPSSEIVTPPELPPEVPPTETTSTPAEPPIVIPPSEATSTPPSIPTEPTGPSANINFEFLGSNGALPLSPDDQGMIGVRGNASVTARLPASSIPGTPRYVVLVIGEFVVQLQLNRSRTYYEGTFSVPPNATLLVKGVVLLSSGETLERQYVFNGYSYGRVSQSPLFGTGMIPVPDATVTLYQERSGVWTVWNGAEYGQRNPQQTTEGGTYLFEVPVGNYYAEVSKEGYEIRKTDPVFVTKNVFNEQIDLVYIPKTMRELLEQASSTTPIAKVGIVVNALKDDLLYQVKKVRQMLSNHEIQDVNTQIIAPSALVISAFNAVAAASVFQWITYLQYLFTQPFLLLWRRKRSRYGVVYNSLTKRPVDLCVVRLVHDETGLVVQTRVTDKQGRYFFNVKQGVYRLVVTKPQYSFPSELISKNADDEYLDVYDGGLVRVKEDGSISLNVPIDPQRKLQAPVKIRARRALRFMQGGIARISILAAIVGLIVTPTVPMALGVLSQFVIYSLFRRLMVPDAPKRWGFVYDARNLKPIKNAVIRLYDQQYRRLLESQLSNNKGQYGFLVGKNEYVLTVEAKGYETVTVEHINLADRSDASIDKVISLKRVGTDTGKKSDLVKVWKKKV